ncbi:PTS sugar transporter subunit IIA [Demequina sediminicola]|uniref:PTS sugar transporter subunit IIA n=1 Tax=Demequina sediminicola TaxID=1095026 RepID=UPI000783EE1C|nr:PTS sugar transporter subunit IIA [Demequina sediminicola]
MNPDARLLRSDAIKLGLTAHDKTDALTQAGALLVEIGAATDAYAAAIHERETSISTYIGEGVAIPHGTNESREHIERAALGFLQYPHGVDWDGETVYACIPIASKSEEHVDILSTLAQVLMDPTKASQLREASTIEDVLSLLSPTTTKE